jgi:hypothetical protein
VQPGEAILGDQAQEEPQVMQRCPRLIPYTWLCYILLSVGDYISISVNKWQLVVTVLVKHLLLDYLISNHPFSIQPVKGMYNPEIMEQLLKNKRRLINYNIQWNIF